MRGLFLLVSLLLLGPSWARAADEVAAARRSSQGSEGYVFVSEVSARVLMERRRSRGLSKPNLHLSATLENRLSLDVTSIRVLMENIPVGGRRQTLLEHDWVVVPKGGQAHVGRSWPLDSEAEGHGVTTVLVGYRLMADPATTPGMARTLLVLSNSSGLVDLAVAAEAHPGLGPDAQRLREELRPQVASGPTALLQGQGRGFAPLYALRLLGRVGNGEDLPTLLSVLKSDEGYQPSLESLGRFRAQFPDHPMSRLFASGTALRTVVEDSVRDMRPELAVPALVSLAYSPGRLAREAREFLSLWEREALVAAMVGPQGVEPLKRLCASGEPDAVPLVVALGVKGLEGVDMKACLSTLPEKETRAELVRLLGGELGALEATAFDVLASRGRAAHALLRAPARELGLPVGSDVATLARAVHSGLLARRMAALQQMRNLLEVALREGRYDDALSLVDDAARNAHVREQRTQVMVGYVRVAQSAAREDHRERLDLVLERLQGLRSGHADEANADPELVALALDIVTHGQDTGVDKRLELLVGMVGAHHRPRLAEAYVTWAGKTSHPFARENLANQALALDASHVGARSILEDVARLRAEEARNQRMLLGGVGLGVLGLAALVYGVRRRDASRARTRKARVLEMLRSGMRPEEVLQAIVFGEGVSRGEATAVLAEAMEELRRGQGA